MNEGAKILMSFTTRITGIRVLNNTLIPTFWDVTTEFFSILDAEQTADGSNVAYNVLYFWISQLMDDILVYDVNDDFGKEFARLSSNTFMTTPGLPTDDLMVQLLHAKMNAIAGEYLGVIKLSLKADDSDLVFHYVDLLGGDALPGIDYIGDVLTAHSKPWWQRDTSECCDTPLPPQHDNITELNTKSPKEDVLERYRNVLRAKLEHGVGDIDMFAFDVDLGLDIGSSDEDSETTVVFEPDFSVNSEEETDSNIIEIPKD